MKAKLKVLLAMSYGARLLILDEPTAGLDVVARDEILELLRGVYGAGGQGCFDKLPYFFRLGRALR